ncbi:hypothetical protein KYY02_15820 [Streptomyces pimonensis]|uniref:Uncharacterized protein n=1 Tax=Streptomyces pimonensis TaxID=2860288 RepID=A0ABV4J3V2_9ACTN
MINETEDSTWSSHSPEREEIRRVTATIATIFFTLLAGIITAPSASAAGYGCSGSQIGIEQELMVFLLDRVADVAGGEVAADDVGLLLASAQEAAGPVGEIVG